MRRDHVGASPRTDRRTKPSNNPLGDETDDTSNNNTHSSYGPSRSPNRRAERPQPGPRLGAARKQPRPRRRHRPGVKALMEIRRYQNSVNILIPKLPFSRVVREVMMSNTNYNANQMRITRDALMALQEAAEMYLTNFFEDSLRLTIHAKRVTVMPRDMQLIAYLRNNWGLL